MYLNNGTSIKTASNQVDIDEFVTGFEFNYTASSTNIIYLIITGSSDKPVASFSYSLIPKYTQSTTNYSTPSDIDKSPIIKNQSTSNTTKQVQMRPQ